MAFRKERQVASKGVNPSSKKESGNTETLDEIVKRGYDNTINELDRKMRAHAREVNEGLIPNNPIRLTVELFLPDKQAREKLAEKLKEKKISLDMSDPISCYASVWFKCKERK